MKKHSNAESRFSLGYTNDGNKLQYIRYEWQQVILEQRKTLMVKAVEEKKNVKLRKEWVGLRNICKAKLSYEQGKNYA